MGLRPFEPALQSLWFKIVASPEKMQCDQTLIRSMTCSVGQLANAMPSPLASLCGLAHQFIMQN